MLAVQRLGLSGKIPRMPEVASKAPDTAKKAAEPAAVEQKESVPPPEIGGPKGPEPTRYGDWEKAGRCIDF